MARDEREQKALDMLNDKSIPTDDIIRYVKGEWDGFYKCHHDYGYHFPYNRCDMWSAKREGDEDDED